VDEDISVLVAVGNMVSVAVAVSVGGTGVDDGSSVGVSVGARMSGVGEASCEKAVKGLRESSNKKKSRKVKK
jgi:hypothetical protein